LTRNNPKDSNHGYAEQARALPETPPELELLQHFPDVAARVLDAHDVRCVAYCAQHPRQDRVDARWPMRCANGTDARDIALVIADPHMLARTAGL